MKLKENFSVPVDLIRTIAMIGVIFLHASNDLTIPQMNTLEFFRWTTVDFYQSLGYLAIPLFLMLTGALLLQPSKKDESLGVFFKKRWARIGLPFIFWGAAYFAWDFLVEHQAVTSKAIIQGILNGPYYQFWYLYMLIGLYLLTPIVRILIAHADRSLIRYLIILWFLGASVVPLISFSTIYSLNSTVFVFTGYVGYFVLGLYLLTVQMRRSTIFTFMSVGIASTAIATYVLAATIGGTRQYYFQEYFSPTIILASVMLFLLLNTNQRTSTSGANSVSQLKSSELGSKLLKLISENTLPIFLFHVMVLESLQRGYFGFAINGSTINSIVGIPLITVITLFICLAVIIPLKKIPILKRLIG